MKQETFTVNSATSAMAFYRHVQDMFAQHKYLTFTWRIGEKRSLDQNALLHVWLTEYAAHLLDKDKKLVTRGELEGMKRHAKRMYYAEHGEQCAVWMIHEVVNPANPEQHKRDFTSSTTWKRGEMYLFLTWLQMKAAMDGLVLESKGEYAELQRKEAA